MESVDLKQCRLDLQVTPPEIPYRLSNLSIIVPLYLSVHRIFAWNEMPDSGLAVTQIDIPKSCEFDTFLGACRSSSGHL